jgi:hypothetical protein
VSKAMTETKWMRDDSWVGSPIEDSFVMVNIDTGAYVALNSTAHAIWDVIENPRTSSEIAATLAGQFDVAADTCSAAVARTLAEMEIQQLARAV